MTTTNIKKELGERVRLYRKRRGLTQEGLADRCGLHWTYIGGLERGERNPTVTTLAKIAGGLEMKLAGLISPRREKLQPDPREKKEHRLLRLLRQKDETTVDLAAGLVREVLNWKERYRTNKD